MSGTNGTAVLDRVRERLAAAEAAGERPPGRPTLANELGVTDHQVKKALAALANQTADTPPTEAPTADTDPVDSTPAAAQPAPEPATNSAPATHQPAARQPGARFVAWLGFAFGSIMSVAANVLHTWLPVDTMPPGWTPGVAPQVGSAVWPIGLLISVEVLSRVQWRPGFLWGVARYGGAGIVAVGSGVISYGHLREVLLAWGYGHPGAEVGPLVLDGLMVVCGFALLSMTPRQVGDQS
jgi:hypothetical protein